MLKSWQIWVILVFAIVAAAGATYLFRPEPIMGLPRADVNAVAAVKQEQADALAKKAADDEAATLSWLEGETLRSMRAYFADPANGVVGERFAVLGVGLIRTGETSFEGLATMTRLDGPSRDIRVLVTADERSSMWRTEPGALMDLYR